MMKGYEKGLAIGVISMCAAIVLFLGSVSVVGIYNALKVQCSVTGV